MNNILSFKIFESIEFKKQPSKKDAKTEIYNVVKDGNIIGQVKWSSRMRGYSFLPSKDCDDKIKTFVKSLMDKRRKAKKSK